MPAKSDGHGSVQTRLAHRQPMLMTANGPMRASSNQRIIMIASELVGGRERAIRATYFFGQQRRSFTGNVLLLKLREKFARIHAGCVIVTYGMFPEQDAQLSLQRAESAQRSRVAL